MEMIISNMAIEFVSNETQSIEKELIRLEIYVFDKLLCISKFGCVTIVVNTAVKRRFLNLRSQTKKWRG